MAKGIDTAAHQSTIAAHGKTIAILATPLDKVCPSENGKLAEEIAAVKAEQDEEILAAAKQVLTLVQPQQASMSKFTIQNNGPVHGQVMESHAPITMNFGELPQSG